ncbi:hypothetical protein P3T22_006092 [Paraburkholderia sp. GAS348]
MGLLANAGSFVELICQLICQFISRLICKDKRRAGDILAHFPVFVSFP